MKNKTIGIIGFGYVGQAIHYLFKDKNDIKVFDIDESKKTHEKEEVNQSDFVFICVPTPMNADGSQNLSFVESALKNFNPNTTYILKSTVVPTTTMTLQKKHPQLKIVFNPEFLTESNWQLDMLNPDRVIIGGDSEQANIIESLYRIVYPVNIPIYLTNSTEAELIKYMANSFLATKVSIMNEFKVLSDNLGLNWQNIIGGFVSDKRIGDSHTQVPGPDGLRGYGGSCFPKDVNALINYAKNQGINLSVIEAGWNSNLLFRPEEDWKLLKGRAII
jgi:UDPglucose 6-dehydrogenase